MSTTDQPESPVSGRTIADYLRDVAHTLAQVPTGAVDEAVACLAEARARGARVFLIGNGGSAATASHLACDLVKAASIVDGPPLRAHSLSDNTALLTAWSNDAAYEDAYALQVASFLDSGDVLFAISASGNSPNILEALRAANALGAMTIALLGFDGGDARDIADVVIHVPCDDYGQVEDVHASVGHAITRALSEIEDAPLQ